MKYIILLFLLYLSNSIFLSYCKDEEMVCIPLKAWYALCNQKPPDIYVQNKNASIASANITQELYNFQTWITQKKNNALTTISAFCEYIWNHKLKTGSFIAISLYLYTFLYIIRTQYFLQHAKNWHNWKKELSLEQILATPTTQLSENLISLILSLYINYQNPADTITPLTKFMESIEMEIKKIKQYIAIGTWLISLKIAIILPINETKILIAQQKLQRVLFIKHIFIEYIASKNMSLI